MWCNCNEIPLCVAQKFYITYLQSIFFKYLKNRNVWYWDKLGKYFCSVLRSENWRLWCRIFKSVSQVVFNCFPKSIMILLDRILNICFLYAKNISTIFIHFNRNPEIYRFWGCPRIILVISKKFNQFSYDLVLVWHLLPAQPKSQWGNSKFGEDCVFNGGYPFYWSIFFILLI